MVRPMILQAPFSRARSRSVRSEMKMPLAAISDLTCVGVLPSDTMRLGATISSPPKPNTQAQRQGLLQSL